MKTTISDRQRPKPAPNHTRRRPILLLASAFASLAIPVSVMADVTIDIEQSGSDVVATETGSIDLSTLTFHASGTNGGPTIIPNGAAILMGNPTSGTEDTYNINSGPTSWGSGAQINASSTTGTYFGMTRVFSFLVVSNNYVSGSPISGTATWNGQTLSGMGLTDGTYVYEAGSVPQTITIEIGQAAAAPEPATLWFALIGGAGFVANGRFARSKKPQREGVEGQSGAAE
jgi:hypothetical protein